MLSHKTVKAVVLKIYQLHVFINHYSFGLLVDQNYNILFIVNNRSKCELENCEFINDLIKVHAKDLVVHQFNQIGNTTNAIY